MEKKLFKLDLKPAYSNNRYQIFKIEGNELFIDFDDSQSLLGNFEIKRDESLWRSFVFLIEAIFNNTIKKMIKFNKHKNSNQIQDIEFVCEQTIFKKEEFFNFFLILTNTQQLENYFNSNPEKVNFIQKNDTGRTPIYIAAKYNLIELALLLISKNADLNLKQINNSTPLHAARYYNNLTISILLLASGCPREHKNEKDMTAYADCNESLKIDRSLEEKFLNIFYHNKSDSGKDVLDLYGLQTIFNRNLNRAEVQYHPTFYLINSEVVGFNYVNPVIYGKKIDFASEQLKYLSLPDDDFFENVICNIENIFSIEWDLFKTCLSENSLEEAFQSNGKIFKLNYEFKLIPYYKSNVTRTSNHYIEGFLLLKTEIIEEKINLIQFLNQYSNKNYINKYSKFNYIQENSENNPLLNSSTSSNKSFQSNKLSSDFSKNLIKGALPTNIDKSFLSCNQAQGITYKSEDIANQQSSKSNFPSIGHKNHGNLKNQVDSKKSQLDNNSLKNYRHDNYSFQNNLNSIIDNNEKINYGSIKDFSCNNQDNLKTRNTSNNYINNKDKSNSIEKSDSDSKNDNKSSMSSNCEYNNTINSSNQIDMIKFSSQTNNYYMDINKCRNQPISYVLQLLKEKYEDLNNYDIKDIDVFKIAKSKSKIDMRQAILTDQELKNYKLQIRLPGVSVIINNKYSKQFSKKDLMIYIYRSLEIDLRKNITELYICLNNKTKKLLHRDFQTLENSLEETDLISSKKIKFELKFD